MRSASVQCVSRHTRGRTGYPGSSTAATLSVRPVWMSCRRCAAASAPSRAPCVVGLPVLVSAWACLGPCGSTQRFGTRSQTTRRERTRWMNVWRIATRCKLLSQSYMLQDMDLSLNSRIVWKSSAVWRCQETRQRVDKLLCVSREMSVAAPFRIMLDLDMTKYDYASERQPNLLSRTVLLIMHDQM